MSAILDQKLLSIKQAAKRIPSRPHTATVWRWIEKGCRGHRLQSWLIGGQRFTSDEAIENFLQAINGKSARPAPTAKMREKSIESAERELSKLGI